MTGAGRKMALALFAVAAPVAAPAQVPAQVPESLTAPIDDPKPFAARFFEDLAGNPAKAYAALRTAGLKAEGIDNLKQTESKIAASIGPILSEEFLEQAHLGKRVTRIAYVVLHPRGPVIESLTFYMAPNRSDWQVISIDVTAQPERFQFPPPK